MTVNVPTEDELGPCMKACSDMERRFVMAFVEQGCRDATGAARRAGFSDPGKQSAAIRVRGYELRRRPRVVAAMRELAHTHFDGLVLPAVVAAGNIIANPRHPDHAKMINAVLSAHGLGPQQHIKVDQTVRDTMMPAVMEKIQHLADKLGLDPAQLLGRSTGDLKVPPIDVEWEVVQPTSVATDGSDGTDG
jgi:hypothetical protein